MKIIKSVGKLFKDLKTKILSLGTPPEEEVDYSKVVQREVTKESVEHQEGVEFSRGTATPPPKMAAKKEADEKEAVSKKPVAKKTVSKKPAVKKTETKTSTIKKATPKKTTTTVKTETDKKKVTPKKSASKTTSTKTKTAKKAAEKKTASDKKTTVVKKKAASTKTETSKKKATPKKATPKKATPKKASTKTTDEKTETKKTSKKAEKIALYTKDIKKHYGEVDSDFLEIIVKNLGPSIYKKDAELVSCSDPKELNTVRKNFLMKKLGIDASQKVLDAAIQDVCEELKATKTKYRATFYYSLAKKFKKESILS